MPVDGFVQENVAEPALGRVGENSKPVSISGHLVRILVVAGFALALSFWLIGRTEIFFADGLRYIAQAKALQGGARAEALQKAVDHPVYPMAIAMIHGLSGADQGPVAWQSAAQWASAIAGLLLVVPFYLTARELFGDSAAFPASLLFLTVPVTGHVFADALSESTFLLFWCWGLWGSLRFLKTGGPPWLVLAVLASGMAFLTRPEGLLLPAALVLTLLLHCRWVLRGLGPRGLLIGLVIAAGVLVTVGPYVALKGGLSSKPSIARLLGKAPRSDALAVERLRPLEPGQSEAKTLALAAKAVGGALAGGVSLPLSALAILGLISLRPTGGSGRQWTLLAVIGLASFLALMRLHATGGYCTPRHAMILSILLIPASVRGIDWVLALGLARWTSSRGLGRVRAGVVLGLMLAFSRATLAPLNPGMRGYKDAGQWLAGRLGDSERVVDVTGWSHFYGGRGGYTFENLAAAEADPDARWVVVREAHLAGPWWYCSRLRGLVKGQAPVREYREKVAGRMTRILIFDRSPEVAARSGSLEAPVIR